MAKRTLAERLWSLFVVNPETGCWLWTNRLNACGYGTVSAQRKHMLAHRAMYELLVGPIPEGLELDHLCRVRHCVNPAHLEPVDHLTNVRRGQGNGRKTHCPRGHLYSPENTRIDRRGCRLCKECQRIHGRASYRRRRGRSDASRLDR